MENCELVPQAIVVELVVAGHGDQASRTCAQRVEYLHCGVRPNLQRIRRSASVNHASKMVIYHARLSDTLRRFCTPVLFRCAPIARLVTRTP